MSFLTTAFVAVWLLVTLYVVFMGWRQRQLESEIKTLEEALEDR